MGELNNKELLQIGIAFASSFILGIIARKLAIPLGLRLTGKTKWKGDDLIIKTIASWIIFWLFLAACLYTLPVFSKSFYFFAENEKTIIKVIITAYIFSVSLALAKILAGIMQIRSAANNYEYASNSILGNITKVLVYCIGLILILRIFGVAIAPLLTALGVGGLAVALALQPTLSNLFAGLQLIASRKINKGDFIQLEGGQKGFVKDITWRNTDILTVENNIIIVPNSKMTGFIIENYFLDSKEILFHVAVGVSYDSDLLKVEQVSIQVAREILAKFEGGIKEFDPFVRFYRFGDSSIDLKIYMMVEEFANQILITSEFIKKLHTRYAEEGIGIPFPIRTVLLSSKEGS